jgi:hypothetical protein
MFPKSAKAKLRAILQTFKKSFSKRIGANCITPDRARADFLPALNDDEAIRRQASQRTLSRSPNQGGDRLAPKRVRVITKIPAWSCLL